MFHRAFTQYVFRKRICAEDVYNLSYFFTIQATLTNYSFPIKDAYLYALVERCTL